MKRKIIGLGLTAVLSMVIALILLLYTNRTQDDWGKLKNKTQDQEIVFDRAVSSSKYGSIFLGVIGLGLGLVSISIKHKDC